MKQAKAITKLARSLLRDAAPGQDPLAAAIHLAPLPPATWVVRGPRGGHYLAVGMRRRVVFANDPFDWMRDEISVVDMSEGVRYVRPARAAALLDQ